jgi:hypothetical protein
MRRISKFFTVFLLGIALFGHARAQEAPPLSQGQVVYVPVYSNILHGNTNSKGQAMQLLLSSMLSIRNTDPKNGMEVISVRYYDTNGKLLREFVQNPLVLGAMASGDYFVEHSDKDGGSGANFLVEWKATKPINPPIIETVNAYFFGTQSVAFTSPGRPIRP